MEMGEMFPPTSWGFLPNPPKRYIPEITPSFTGLADIPFLPFLRVFLDDMGVGKIEAAPTHPLIQLTQAIPWQALAEIVLWFLQGGVPTHRVSLLPSLPSRQGTSCRRCP